MASNEYDVLPDTDDPDVAFLATSDNLEFRPPRRKRAAGRPAKPSRFCSPILWIVLLCMLLGGLALVLVIILYHRSHELVGRLSFQSSLSNGSFFEDSSATRKIVLSVPKYLKDPLTESVAKVTECMWQSKRLPDTLKPVRYDLYLHPNLTLERYAGKVSIDITIEKKASLVVLHAKNLTIKSAEVLLVDPEEKTGNLVSRIHNCDALDQLQLAVRSMLLPGNTYRIIIVFDGKLRDTSDGFYLSRYKDGSGNERLLATTQFEPGYARLAFPCFDEPDFKAVFKVRITHDKNLTAVSNAVVESRAVSSEGSNCIDTEFKDTLSMSTYLLAFLVSDFNKTTVRSDDLTLDLYASPSKLNQSSFALEAASKVVKFYGEFFGIPYPLPKLDMAAIPDFSAGAMENWGLITYREATLLVDSNESSLAQQERVASVIAHEIAHQWFGNLVTMSWWDELWLNEGFATFMQNLGMDAIDPNLTAMQLFPVTVIQTVLPQDSLPSTHPIVAHVEDLSDIEAIFDDISYHKGASVLWMLHRGLGEDVFRKGVTDYLNAHKYGNAKTLELWNALDKAWQSSGKGGKVGLTVQAIADSWTSQPGFPLLTTQRTAKGITVVQERMVPFVSHGDRSSRWNIPVSCITSLDSNEKKLWMSDVTAVIEYPETVRPAWYKLKQVGFYRVNYEEDNWKAITDALRTDHAAFTPEDCANLVDDVVMLARGGKLNATIALDLMSYLSKERRFMPWITAGQNLESLDKLFFATSFYSKFVKWRRRLLQPAFTSLSCDKVDTKDYQQRRLCIAVYSEACRSGLPECIAHAKNLFREFRSSGVSIPVDIRRAVYRTGIEFGDDDDWEALWTRYQTTMVASEKSILMNALGATRDPWRINRLLALSVDPHFIRPDDAVSVFYALAAGHSAQEEVWKAIRHNWDLFIQRYGHSTTIARFFDCLHWMGTQKELDDVKAFFETPGRQLGAGKLAYGDTLEIIGLHKKFLDVYSLDIANWLDKNVQKRV